MKYNKESNKLNIYFGKINLNIKNILELVEEKKNQKQEKINYGFSLQKNCICPIDWFSHLAKYSLNISYFVVLFHLVDKKSKFWERFGLYFKITFFLYDTLRFQYDIWNNPDENWYSGKQMLDVDLKQKFIHILYIFRKSKIENESK